MRFLRTTRISNARICSQSWSSQQGLAEPNDFSRVQPILHPTRGNWASIKNFMAAMHTLELPNGNRSTDEQIIEFAERERRIVVTKDADFVNSHLLSARPAKLLLISTGNIGNRELEPLVNGAVPILVQEFQSHAFLELRQAGITVRG